MIQKPLIKICGFKDATSTVQAVRAGVNFIGLVFHPTSKRYVNIETAAEISKIVKENGAEPVGVFVDHSAGEIKEICEKTGINIVQLHGAKSKQRHHLLPAHYQRIYVQFVTADGIIKNDVSEGLAYCDHQRDFLLFDRETPGKGITYNWEKFHYDGRFRWFLAGGLTPDNVSAGIEKLKPHGVDVSSGVENNLGEKDILLMREFIDAAKTSQIS